MSGERDWAESTEPIRLIFPESAALPAAAPLPEPGADREQRNSFYRYLMHLGVPVSVSLCLHAGIMVFLAVKVFHTPARSSADVGAWEGTVVNRDEVQSAFSWADQPLVETPEDQPMKELAFSPDDLRSTSLDELKELSTGEADSAGKGSGKGEGEGFGLGEGGLRLLGTGGGAGESGSGGFGSGLGGGTRIGRAMIYGVPIQANRIVFVVDYSGSIVVCVDDLKRELKRSIGRLLPKQSFDVILFYSTTGGGQSSAKAETFKPKLEPATDAVRREFFQWIDRKAPQGDTEPMPAIQRALELQPEAIVLLSDGFFEDKVVGEITAENKKVGARVYCLVFDDTFLADTSGLPPKDNDGSLRMKRIAEANGGQTKIVTGKDLTK